MNMQLFLFILLSSFFTGGCVEQSQLPEKMPEKVSFSFYEGGGKTRFYRRFVIEGTAFEVSETVGEQDEPEKWSANISDKYLADLYRSFVENRFDLIKNDARQGTVYDAGSENISISIAEIKSFSVIYSKMSPLSGDNLRRYEKVKEAFHGIWRKYQTH